MSRARNEDGVAMIMAVIILFIILGLGTALLATSQSQQRSASNQQGSESAYALAEAALNAQIFELSLRWPTQQDSPSPASPSNYGYPYSCKAASNGVSYCPTPTDFSSNYPVSSGTCPAGTQGDAWNTSSTVTNGWTTYVRDAGAPGGSASQLFSSPPEENANYFDNTGSANPNAGGNVWVRAAATVNCHTAVVITRVADQVVNLNFPNYVLNANSFTITNNGNNKTIINTEDTNGNTSAISLRCNGDGGLPPNQTCANAQNPASQIQPSADYTANPAPTPTLSAAQLAAAKNLAIANGTYFPPGTCPTEAQLAGNPVFVDDTASQPCNMSFHGNSPINSFTSPGLLIVLNGQLDFEGSETFYGVIYGANQSGLSTPVVTLGGTATVDGGMAVDGSASLNLGSSGNGNVSCTDTSRTQKCGDLEYNSTAFNGLVGFAGAAPAPNTFRQLPATQ